MTTLQDLLGRVEEATGPDQEIDMDLERLILTPADGAWETEEVFGPPGYGFKRWILRKADGTIFVHGRGRRYTTSLDATLGLVERILPGWSWMVRAGAWAKVWAPIGQTFGAARVNDFDASAPTPPLALLAALLRALIAQAATPEVQS